MKKSLLVLILIAACNNPPTAAGTPLEDEMSVPVFGSAFVRAGFSQFEMSSFGVLSNNSAADDRNFDIDVGVAALEVGPSSDFDLFSVSYQEPDGSMQTSRFSPGQPFVGPIPSRPPGGMIRVSILTDRLVTPSELVVQYRADVVVYLQAPSQLQTARAPLTANFATVIATNAFVPISPGADGALITQVTYGRSKAFIALQNRGAVAKSIDYEIYGVMFTGLGGAATLDIHRLLQAGTLTQTGATQSAEYNSSGQVYDGYMIQAKGPDNTAVHPILDVAYQFDD